MLCISSLQRFAVLYLQIQISVSVFFLIDSTCKQALAQDQMRALLSISKGLDDSINIGIYDGDTSMEDRLWLRDNARLVYLNCFSP